MKTLLTVMDPIIGTTTWFEAAEVMQRAQKLGYETQALQGQVPKIKVYGELTDTELKSVMNP